MPIYHITTQAHWNAFKDKGYYEPEAYRKEGFIHCCEVHQLQEVLLRYFQGQSSLLLLHIDEMKLTAPLKREVSTGGKLFPHIYGHINKEAIARIESLGKVL